jgi:hypothetical protein
MVYRLKGKINKSTDLRRIFEHQREEEERDNHIMKSDIIYTLHQILLHGDQMVEQGG